MRNSNKMQICIKFYKLIHSLLCVIEARSIAATLIDSNNSFSDNDNLKYILMWEAEGDFKNLLGEGQDVFIQNDCSTNSCSVTSNRNLFGGDVKKFDAILFNGWDLKWYERGILPHKRYYHQKYAYVQKKSAEKTYVCHTGFDNFFNWSITYKLDSDIVFPHIHVSDLQENIVGPKKDMHWTANFDVNETIGLNLENKTKAAAWFYTNCYPLKTNRVFVEKLEQALNKEGFNIDIYGKCGPLQCREHECGQMLEKEYYFYLAIEDSFAEDYVTGNILWALSNNVVPIVYGGAEYSRFLPPASYLDGTTQTPKALASEMNRLMKNLTLYRKFFQWKSHYRYCLGPASRNVPVKGLGYCGKMVCDLCQALHDPNKSDVHSAYKDFRKWWYPDYINKCEKRHAYSSPNMINEPQQKKDVTYTWSKQTSSNLKQSKKKIPTFWRSPLKTEKNKYKQYHGKQEFIKNNTRLNTVEQSNKLMNEYKAMHMDKFSKDDNDISTLTNQRLKEGQQMKQQVNLANYTIEETKIINTDINSINHLSEREKLKLEVESILRKLATQPALLEEALEKLAEKLSSKRNLEILEIANDEIYTNVRDLGGGVRRSWLSGYQPTGSKASIGCANIEIDRR